MALPTIEPRQNNVSLSANQLTFALTTLFTPPPDCSKPILTSSADYVNYWVPGSEGGTTTFFGSAWSCYPKQFYLTNDLVPLYSPGACPHGFQIVSAATPLSPAITYATCCPSGATTFSGYFCTGDEISEITTINDDKSTILNGKYLFEYPPLTLAWQSSDLPKFSPPSAPLLAYRSAVETGVSVASSTSPNPGATISTPGPTATSAPSSDTSSDNDNQDDGLSTGAKAGIGVGVGLGALILIGLLVWMLMRRRKQKQREPWPSSDATPIEERYEKRIDDSDTRWHTYRPPQEGEHGESRPWMRSELSADAPRAELEAKDAPQR